MKKTILLYGLLGGVLVVSLKLAEYRFLVVEHSLAIYGGLVASVFSALGIWLGLRAARHRDTVVIRETPRSIPAAEAATFVADQVRIDHLRITKREYEILELIAKGLSNREIAERLFVSENTVKTHAGRVLAKLNAKRRTQAVQIAKEAGIIA